MIQRELSKIWSLLCFFDGREEPFRLKKDGPVPDSSQCEKEFPCQGGSCCVLFYEHCHSCLFVKSVALFSSGSPEEETKALDRDFFRDLVVKESGLKCSCCFHSPSLLLKSQDSHCLMEAQVNGKQKTSEKGIGEQSGSGASSVLSTGCFLCNIGSGIY